MKTNSSIGQKIDRSNIRPIVEYVTTCNHIFMSSNTNDLLIKQTIINMLISRSLNKSICPSEVARTLFGNNWREQMVPVRNMAHELFIEGKIDITQKNESVGINYKGPIRLKMI